MTNLARSLRLAPFLAICAAHGLSDEAANDLLGNWLQAAANPETSAYDAAAAMLVWRCGSVRERPNRPPWEPLEMTGAGIHCLADALAKALHDGGWAAKEAT